MAVTPRPVHRDHARHVLVGLGVIVGFLVVGAVGAIVQTGGALPGKHYTYVNAMFHDVGTLRTTKEVKEHGLAVGVVSAIKYVHG